jgi:hypothetical protein
LQAGLPSNYFFSTSNTVLLDNDSFLISKMMETYQYGWGLFEVWEKNIPNEDSEETTI